MTDRTSTSDEIDLLTVFRVINVYRVSIALCAFVFALAAAGYALTAVPLYRGEVVLTEAGDDGMSGLGSIASQLGGLSELAGVSLRSNSAGKESLAVLKSKHLIDEFITRNDLLKELMKDETERNTLWWASRKFQEEVVSIREDTRAGTITVTVEWTDPKLASDWANGFVSLANELMRMQAMEEASRSIAYLKKQLEETDVVGIKDAIYKLIEAQTKTLMLTNARTEYSFKIVDPSRPPEFRVWPRRTSMVLFGGFLGFLLGSIVAFVRRSMATPRQL